MKFIKDKKLKTKKFDLYDIVELPKPLEVSFAEDSMSIKSVSILDGFDEEIKIPQWFRNVNMDNPILKELDICRAWDKGDE